MDVFYTFINWQTFNYVCSSGLFKYRKNVSCCSETDKGLSSIRLFDSSHFILIFFANSTYLVVCNSYHWLTQQLTNTHFVDLPGVGEDSNIVELLFWEVVCSDVVLMHSHCSTV